MWIFTQGTAGKRHRCLVNYFWKTESVYYSWHLGGKELELINSRGVISSCQTTLQSNFISISNLGFIGFTVEYKQSTFSRFYFNTLCDGSSKCRVIIYRLRGRAEWFWFCLCNFLMIPLPPSSLFPPPSPLHYWTLLATTDPPRFPLKIMWYVIPQNLPPTPHFDEKQCLVPPLTRVIFLANMMQTCNWWRLGCFKFSRASARLLGNYLIGFLCLWWFPIIWLAIDRS